LGSYMYWVWSYVGTALSPSGSLHAAVRWIMHGIRLSAGDGATQAHNHTACTRHYEQCTVHIYGMYAMHVSVPIIGALARQT
jgi:hypothetical protein